MAQGQYVRGSVLMNEDQNNVCRIYRKPSVQITLKTVMSMPYVAAWVLWMTDVVSVKDGWKSVLYDFILTGTVTSYMWLVVSSFFCSRFALDVWSYFSIIWSVPTILSMVQLVLLKKYLHGCILFILAMTSLLDGLITANFMAPTPARRDTQVSPRKGEELFGDGKSEGLERPSVLLVPLEGGPSVALDEYPILGSPSTSAQAYPGFKS